MIYLVYGFICGFAIPYIARRFNKFMPATLGYAIYKILKPVKRSKVISLKKRHLLKKYFYRSVLIGLIVGFLFYVFSLRFGGSGLFLKLLFVWLLVLLSEIDHRMMLLPDIITFPLVLLGFFASLYAFSFTNVIDSSLGSLVGYFLPVFASMLLVWKNKDAFGGGDIKFLAVIGAWCGVDKLLFVIMLASISFGVYALLKKQRAGAFGPWLSFATLAVLILFS
ncbi:MAG: A24 family peptidase [Alphaproteobacteria bacterium]